MSEPQGVTMFLGFTVAAVAAIPLPLPVSPGPSVGVGVERAGEEPGQWATTSAGAAFQGRAWRVSASVPAAVVVEPQGVRTGLGAPEVGLAAVADRGTAGLVVTLPIGTVDVSQRSWAVTPWLGATLPAGALQIGAQAGFTWAPGADPVILPAADRTTQAHGALVPIDPGRPAPTSHLHAAPIHHREVHARLWTGAAEDRFVAALLDLRHGAAATTLEAGLLLAGSRARGLRPSVLVALPVVATAASGLHVAAGLEWAAKPPHRS